MNSKSIFLSYLKDFVIRYIKINLEEALIFFFLKLFGSNFLLIIPQDFNSSIFLLNLLKLKYTPSSLITHDTILFMKKN
jgi:hypothetical protein